MPKPRQPPRRPPPKNDPDIGRQVMINCRAKSGCPGKLVEIRMKFRLPSGGNSIRYKCLTCGGSFHITL